MHTMLSLQTLYTSYILGCNTPVAHLNVDMTVTQCLVLFMHKTTDNKQFPSRLDLPLSLRCYNIVSNTFHSLSCGFCLVQRFFSCFIANGRVYELHAACRRCHHRWV